MKDLVNITNRIQYENIFEDILASKDVFILKTSLTYLYSGHGYHKIDPFLFRINEEQKIWMILPSNFENSNLETIKVLNKWKFKFYSYKNLIYGFYNKVLPNKILIVCDENERYNENYKYN